MNDLRQTELTTVQRIPERGCYDRELAHSILAEALVCHVGFSYRDRPLVLPMAFVRFEESIRSQQVALTRARTEQPTSDELLSRPWGGRLV